MTGPLAAVTTTDTSAGQSARDHGRDLIAAMMRLSGLANCATAWTVDERRAVLQLVDRAVDGLAAVRAALLVAERASGTWQGAGDRSFQAWRERTARTSPRAAATQVRQAEQLAAVPSVTAAMTDGRIGLEHAEAIAKVAATGTPAQQQAAVGAQEDLVRLAEHQDAGTFALTVARWAATQDPDGLERDHEAQRAERYLNVSTTPRGTYVKGQLDTIAGHRLTLALEALSPRPAVEDDRGPGQRRADALDAMAGRILAMADTKPGGHVPPQVSMILSAETWAAARAERDRRRDADAGSEAVRRPGTGRNAVSRPGCATGGSTTEPIGVTESATTTQPATTERVGVCEPATLEDGTPIPMSEVAATMCDCEITRIVIDAERAPLDLGRSQRLYTGSQRRAVIARDRHCAWPDCHAPARWCEIHHVDWWERDDGPTSVDNGVLLCSYHHHEVHRRDLTITRLPATRSPSPSAERTAHAVYEFRDRQGRLVGSRHGSRPPPDQDERHHATLSSNRDDPRSATPVRNLGERHATLTPDRGERRSATLAPDGARGGGDTATARAGPATLAGVDRVDLSDVLPRPRAHQDRRSPTRSSGDPPDGERPVISEVLAAGPRGRGVTDEFDLGWTTDPVTGTRVPRFLLAD